MRPWGKYRWCRCLPNSVMSSILKGSGNMSESAVQNYNICVRRSSRYFLSRTPSRYIKSFLRAVKRAFSSEVFSQSANIFYYITYPVYNFTAKLFSIPRKMFNSVLSLSRPFYTPDKKDSCSFLSSNICVFDFCEGFFSSSLLFLGGDTASWTPSTSRWIFTFFNASIWSLIWVLREPWGC